MNNEFLNRLKIALGFKFKVVLCRIRLFPTTISKIKWLGSELPLSTETNDDPKAGAGLVGSTKKDDWMNVQKWKMIDGKLVLASNDQLLVTGSETGSVTLQGKGTGCQNFDKRVTDFGKSIGKFCGNDKPSDFKSRGNEVIVLHYEAGNNDDSFTLDWIANEDVCGEEMIGPEGVIMSPNFPQPYDSGQGSADISGNM